MGEYILDDDRFAERRRGTTRAVSHLRLEAVDSIVEKVREAGGRNGVEDVPFAVA